MIQLSQKSSTISSIYNLDAPDNFALSSSPYVVDAVGSNVIAAGVNAIVEGEEINVRKLGEDIVSDLVESAFCPDFFPTNDVPKYIRDIKREARENGVKGTKKLLKYLDRKQVTTIIDNAINSTLNDELCNEFSEASIFN